MPQFNQIHKLFGKYQLATRLGKEMDHLGWGPGLVVMGGDSYSKGRGFECRHCILDGHHIYLL